MIIMGTSKICRFCLREEKNDTNNEIIDIFDCTLDILYEKISHCTGICLSPEDPIPSLICKSCIDIINQFTNFMETIKSSEKVLQQLYVHKYPPEPKSEIAKKEEIATQEEFVSCDSDSSINDFEINTDDQNTTSPASISPQNDGDTLFFSGGKKLSICELDETMRKQMEGNSYTCDICSKVFDSFFEYQDHQHSHNGHFVFCCSKCDQTFSSRNDLVEHERNHKVSCETCNSQVLTKSLEAHMKKHTDKHKCTECDSRHTSKASMEKHYKARHTDIKGYVCHICGKQNSCQSSMKRHIASHFSDRPHQCKSCTFSAKSKTVLKVHESRKHSNQKCVCEVCEKVFKSTLSLLQHKKRIHNPKKHQCHVCDKAFTEKYNLSQHLSRKHLKQRIHECGECNKEFATVRQLREHKFEHRKGHKVSCLPKSTHSELQKSDVKSVTSMPNTSIQLNKD
ncbi:unnamed protein product [Phaedon cochleariae]|uniref:Uncharacterized protein n=1 Tax=Phaedon cochleariae TaxID=80249 RepID=A0A9P0GU76_PHACE|nr:unnamed protein product [Phaedon cochleariae]